MRFRPGTAAAVLGLPASEVRDARVPEVGFERVAESTLGVRVRGQSSSDLGRRAASEVVIEPQAVDQTCIE